MAKQNRLFRIVWKLLQEKKFIQSQLNTYLQITYQIDKRTANTLIQTAKGRLKALKELKVFERANRITKMTAVERQIGKYKADVMKARMEDINPQVKVQVHKCFFLPENAEEFPFEEYDYIVDAVDTVTAKIELVMKAQEKGVPIISCMGAGNKFDPGQFKVADLYKTKMCPLAKVMRRELKKRGVKKLKVVYSEEKPMRPVDEEESSCRTDCVCPPGSQRTCSVRRDIPGSLAFVPSVAGLMIAGEVTKDLIEKETSL